MLAPVVLVVLVGCQDEKPRSPEHGRPPELLTVRAESFITNRGPAIIDYGGVPMFESTNNGIHVIVSTNVIFSTTNSPVWNTNHTVVGVRTNPYTSGIRLHWDAPCKHPHWLVFIWAEALDAKDKPQAGSVQLLDPTTDPPTAINRDFTVPPAKPNWSIDTSPNSPTPYYDDWGAHTADHQDIFDRPSAKRTFDKNADIMTVVDHFEAFCICDDKVVFHMGWKVTLRRKTGAVPVDELTPEYELEGQPQPGGDLSPEQKAAHASTTDPKGNWKLP